MNILQLEYANYLHGEIKKLDKFLNDLEKYGLDGEVETELHVISREVLSDGVSTQTNFDRIIMLDNDVLDEIVNILKKKRDNYKKELEDL